MKVSFLFLSFILLSSISKAQDTICFRTGEKIAGHVLKVSGEEVEYKRADNPSGPVYASPRDRIAMIKYEGGKQDVFAISHADRHQRDERPRTTRITSPKKSLVRGIVLTTVGSACLAGGLTTLLLGINAEDQMAMVAGGLLASAGIPLTIIGSITIHHANKALRNKKLNFGDEIIGFNPVLSPAINGAGTMSFKAGIGMNICF